MKSKNRDRDQEGPSIITHSCCQGCKWLISECIMYGSRYNEYISHCQHPEIIEEAVTVLSLLSKPGFIGKDQGETYTPYWCPFHERNETP